jgi:hypothetical protein
MATVMERSVVTSVGRGRAGATRPSRLPITLADLITAIQEVVSPEDDGLVVATVRHLLRARRLTMRGTGSRRCPPQRPEQEWPHTVAGGLRHPSAVARRWLCARGLGRSGERGATRSAAVRSSDRR